MYKEECISNYRRLMQLMDEDLDKISQGLQGEILDSYRDLVNREKDILLTAHKSLQNMN